MRVINLGLTCNNACIFCAPQDFSIPVSPRDVSALVALVEPGEVVGLQGGEPTLREDLPEIVRTIDEHRAGRIVLQTNGRRFAYRAYARAMRESSSALSLDVSLHGSTEAMHEYHTETPGSFKQTVLGIRNARAEGIEIGVTTVVTRSNYRHLADIAQIVAGLGARAVHFPIVERFGRAAQNALRLVPPRELVKPYLSRGVAEAKRLGLRVVVGDQGAEELFVGIGEVAKSELEETSRKSLPVLSAGVFHHGRRVRDIAWEAVSDNGEQRQSQ